MPTLADRLAAIDRTGLLDAPPDAAFERAARLAAAVLDAPIAHTTFVLDDRQFYPSQVGLPEPIASARQTGLEISFCRYVVDDDAPWAVDDARVEPRLADNPAVHELGVSTYAGVPLRAPDGVTIGTVCVLGMQPRRWRDEDVRALEDLAEFLRTELVLREEVGRLRTARQDRFATGLALASLRELRDEVVGALDRGEAHGDPAVDGPLTAMGAVLDQLADRQERPAGG